MLPIISSIIIGQGDKVTKTRGGFLALIYVLGTALVWTIAGAVAGASGQQLQAYTSSPYFVLPVAIILILLSLAMFGMYNLQMPASLQSRAQEKSTGLKSGTVLGVFIMGVLASVIAGACVSPILILNLGVAMQAHDAAQGRDLDGHRQVRLRRHADWPGPVHHVHHSVDSRVVLVGPVPDRDRRVHGRGPCLTGGGQWLAHPVERPRRIPGDLGHPGPDRRHAG
ncbi:MAG: cytochrome c biogenesis protein CcdA [Gammaproteobacteria bacterium]